MSIELMSRVWKHAPVSGGSLLVLLALADFADDKGWAWPSVNTLAKRARLGRRQVQYVLHDMEEQGLIKVGLGAGPGGANLYKVLVGGAVFAPVQFATGGGAVECTQTIIGTINEEDIVSMYPSSSKSNAHARKQ